MWVPAMLAAAAVTAIGVTPEEVATLAPSTLGERLLAALPTPIVAARLYGDGIPPAPGEPRVTRIMLYERPRPGFAPDFCEQVRHLVRLRPVSPGQDDALPPAPAAADSPTTLYRFRPVAAGAGCDIPGAAFFSVGDGDAGLVFAQIRALAAMQADPARLRGITVTVDDALGRADALVAGAAGPLTDPLRALQAFPTSEIDHYAYRSGGPTAAMTFYAGCWSVELASGGNSYATAKVVVRRSPAPPPP